MLNGKRATIADLGTGLVILALGFVLGFVIEQTRVGPGRAVALERHANPLGSAEAVPTRGTDSADGALATAAVSRGDAGAPAHEHDEVQAAELAWREAYATALRSRTWDGLLATGDAYVRMGRAAGYESSARAKARELYSVALVRAETQRSLDGILHVAQAFAVIGARDDVEHSLRAAEELAVRTHDADGPRRLTAFRAQWTAGAFGPLEP